MDFPKNLKELREKNNLTQEELANKLNVSKYAIQKYEQGKNIEAFKNLEKLTIILNCSYNDLLK